MHLGPWVLFLGMVAVVGGLPLWFATLRPPLRTNLLYSHLGVLQLLRGFLAVTYVMPLGGGLEMAPGNVLYAGIIMTAVVLVLVERRTAVLRTVVLVLLGTEAVKLVVFATTRWALGSPDFVNVIGVDPAMFTGYLRVSGVGNLLIVGELLVVVVVLEQVRRRMQRARVQALWCVVVLCATIVADGVLFPLATRPFDPALAAAVAGGVERKAVLAAAFGVPLLAFVLLRPEPVKRSLSTSLRLRDTLFAPRHRLIARLEDQEVERVALLERTVHVAEEERRRLAEDLHDDAIQLLTAADLRLQIAARDAPGVDLEPARRLVRDGVDSLRRLILEQHGPEVTADTFEELVRSYGERLLPTAGVTLETDVALPRDLPPPIIAAAYRIVLEALSNVARHAGASNATVRVAVADDLVVGAVTDDGVGIPDDVETGPGHLGLRAMRDRAELVGGRVSVAATDGGTRVSFELPLDLPRRGGQSPAGSR